MEGAADAGCRPDAALFPRQVVSGLKQRILKLEQQCREKDSTIQYAEVGRPAAAPPRPPGPWELPPPRPRPWSVACAPCPLTAAPVPTAMPCPTALPPPSSSTGSRVNVSASSRGAKAQPSPFASSCACRFSEMPSVLGLLWTSLHLPRATGTPDA